MDAEVDTKAAGLDKVAAAGSNYSHEAGRGFDMGLERLPEVYVAADNAAAVVVALERRIDAALVSRYDQQVMGAAMPCPAEEAVLAEAMKRVGKGIVAAEGCSSILGGHVYEEVRRENDVH